MDDAVLFFLFCVHDDIMFYLNIFFYLYQVSLYCIHGTWRYQHLRRGEGRVRWTCLYVFIEPLFYI